MAINLANNFNLAFNSCHPFLDVSTKDLYVPVRHISTERSYYFCFCNRYGFTEYDKNALPLIDKIPKKLAVHFSKQERAHGGNYFDPRMKKRKHTIASVQDVNNYNVMLFV